jgi:hypothetical protein
MAYSSMVVRAWVWLISALRLAMRPGVEATAGKVVQNSLKTSLEVPRMKPRLS